MSLDVGLEVAGEVGVVGDERGRLRRGPGPSPPRRAASATSACACSTRRGRQPSDREVRQRVVAVDRGEQRIGDGPQVGGLRPQRRQRRGLRRADEVPRVVARVAEQQHVARRGPRPGLEGVGEEALDRLGRGLAVAELGGDLLEGDGARREALVLPPLDERLGGGEEGPRARSGGSRPGSRRSRSVGGLRAWRRAGVSSAALRHDASSGVRPRRGSAALPPLGLDSRVSQRALPCRRRRAVTSSDGRRRRTRRRLAVPLSAHVALEDAARERRRLRVGER